jgi:hypothetical protein
MTRETHMTWKICKPNGTHKSHNMCETHKNG